MDKADKELVTVLFSLLLMTLEICSSSDKGICIIDGIENITEELMSVAETCRLEIKDLCDPNCLLRASLDDILCMQHDFETNISIAAVLEQGNHTPSNTTDGHLHIANQNNLILSGNGDKQNVVLKRIHLILSDIKTLI